MDTQDDRARLRHAHPHRQGPCGATFLEIRKRGMRNPAGACGAAPAPGPGDGRKARPPGNEAGPNSATRAANEPGFGVFG